MYRIVIPVMKHICFSLAALLFAVGCVAQKGWFGEAGITQSNFWYNKAGKSDEGSNSRSSFYLAGGLRTALNKKLSLQNSIGYYSRRYYYHFFFGPDNGGNSTYNLQSILIKSVLTKDVSLRKNLSLSPGAGIYGTMATGGHVNYLIDGFAVIKGDRKIAIGNGASNDFKRFEGGLSVQVQLQYKSFYLQPAYSFALTGSSSVNTKQTWKFFTFGIGYVLRK